MLPLSHPKSAFHVSGNHQVVSHLVAPRNLSFSARVTWWFSCMVLSGLLLTVGCDCWDTPPFCALVARIDHWEKRDAFLSASDSQYSHSMVGRLRVGSVTSQEALSYSVLGYILRNWKLLTLQKAWLQYKQNHQKWPLNGTLSFCKRRERTQNFLTFCCLPVSCPSLSLSIRFPRWPLLNLS